LKRKSILITGGGGFIGSHLAEKFINESTDQNICFSGGGSSFQDAVKILGATSTATGIGAEKIFISNIFGEEGSDWWFLEQELLFTYGKTFDRITIKMADDTLSQIYFDVSEFYGN